MTKISVLSWLSSFCLGINWLFVFRRRGNIELCVISIAMAIIAVSPDDISKGKHVKFKKHWAKIDSICGANSRDQFLPSLSFYLLLHLIVKLSHMSHILKSKACS